MKSVTEMLRFLQQCLSSKRDERRAGPQKMKGLGFAEAVEARLLLAADLSKVLFSPVVVGELSPDTAVDSYFVTFDSPQSISTLQAATDAASVEASEFVENGYTLNLNQGLTLQEAADAFSGLSGFDSLHPNVARQHSTRAVPNDPLFVDQWHLLNTAQGQGVAGADANIQGAWDKYTGAGVTIGIIDDGLEVTHEDLAPNVNTAIDFDWNGNDNDPSPNAGNGDFHGTSVAGVAAGKGNNGIGVSGAAWDAELVGLRLIAGGVTDQQEAQALTHQSGIIDIYNNSWGPADNGRISSIGPQALAALRQAATTGRGGLGNIHTWAGGNGGDATNDNVNYDPYANSRFTIAVGALTNSGVRSSYSDTGASLIVTAYSNGGDLGITTTDITGNAGYSTTNYANDFGGTSSATPLVSGVIALMLEANPNLSYRDVTDILARTAERVDPTNNDWVQNGAGLWVNHEYGFGGIDATAAVTAAETHVSLPVERSSRTGVISVGQTIPDVGGPAVTSTVNVSAANAISSLEYVEVVFSATHSYIGDLEVVLTSPDGTQSILAETRPQDGNPAYNNWVFSTARHWDESSEGDWTISVRDGAANGVGTFDSYELVFYGTNQSVSVIETNGRTVVSDSGQITDTVSVVLSGRPSSDVVLSVTSSDTSEVVPSVSTLTFTPSNWDRPQVVTVNGVRDLIDDGDQLSNLVIAVVDASSDDTYDGASDVIVSVTSIDDDDNLPAKPVFTSPGQLPSTASPAFVWSSVDNALTYNLTVTNVFTGNVVQQRVGLNLPRHTFASPFVNGIYSAVVEGVNAAGIPGTSSDPLLFSIGAPTVPAAPVITSPTQGSVLTTNLPVIQWRHSAGALDYELWLSSNGNVTRVRVPGVDIGGGLRTYTPTTPLSEGPNSVWIRAYNPFGDAGEWSVPVGFTVDAFAAPSIPMITAPILTVTTDATPTFRWIGAGATSYELWVEELPGGDSNVIAPTRVIYVTNFSANEYTHFRSLNNAKHRAWVRGVNAAGEKSDWSPHVDFTVDVPQPQLPSLVDIGTTADQTPTFTWGSVSGDSFGGDTTFTLWVNNLTTGQARAIHQTGIQGTSYTPSQPLPQGRYAAWVQAVSAVGVKSAWSSRILVTIDQPAPDAPTIIGPVAVVGARSATIQTDLPEFEWTATVGAATYELWVNHIDSGTVRIVHEKGIADTKFTPALRLPEGSFKAWVRGYNLAGEVGEWSAAYSFSLDVPAPSIPTITGPPTNAVGTVIDPTPTITWAMLVPAASYDLQVEVASTGALVVDETGIPSEQYTVPFQLNETTYRTRARAENSAGEKSEWSEWSTFRIDVPNATTPFAFGPVGTVLTNSVTFQWQHTSGNMQYEILVRDLLKQESITFRDFTFQVDPDQSRATITRNLPNGTYRFWVRAFNSQGTASAWSNSLSFTVENKLTALRSELPVNDDRIAVTPELRFQPDEVTGKGEADVVEDPAVVEAAEVGTESPENSGQPLPLSETTPDLDTDALEAVMSELADPASAGLLYPTA